MNKLTATDWASLRNLDRQWGELYDIAVSSLRWVTPTQDPATTAPGSGRSVPTTPKWVGQRRSDLRWIIAGSAQELARRIAADYAACPVAREPQP